MNYLNFFASLKMHNNYKNLFLEKNKDKFHLFKMHKTKI